MTTLRNKRKSAAVFWEKQEQRRNSQSQNTFVPRYNEEYITEVPEVIEGRVTKQLSQGFSRIESRLQGIYPS